MVVVLPESVSFLTPTSTGGSAEQLHITNGELTIIHSYVPSLPHRQPHTGRIEPQHSVWPSSTTDPASHALPSMPGGHGGIHSTAISAHCQAPSTQVQEKRSIQLAQLLTFTSEDKWYEPR